MSADVLTASTLHAAKRTMVDTIGCAVGGIDAPPARIAREMAGDVTAKLAATVMGSRARSTAELGAFANAVMVRYLDYNDMYFSPVGGGGHPSDIISTAIAVGEALGSSGRDVLLSVVVGYEVLGALAGTVRLRERGWDQGLNAVVATAVMAGKLLGLTKEQLGHAISLAIIPHIPARQTRVGELSMWKGCATAGAARNGIFAALLASKGMTGPPEPFEGFDGIKQLVTGPFELALPTAPGPFVIERTHTKSRPAEYNAQGPLDLILRLRPKIDLAHVQRIHVDTYWLAYSEIGMEKQKWDPQTRETADHSIPYLLAVALVDGDVGLGSFTLDRVRDARLRPLMAKISVAEDKDYSRRFPAELGCRISVTGSGGTMTEEVLFPKGHARNPMSDAEIDRKFDALVETRGSRDAEICRGVRTTLWSLETVKDMTSVVEPLGQLRTS